MSEVSDSGMDFGGGDAVGTGSAGGGFFGIGSIGGKVMDIESIRKQQNANYDRQKEFARSGIQWRVKDAEAAGVHPLYALGANVSTFGPTSPINPGVGDFVQRMGQDVSRSARATMTQEQRTEASLRNALLGAQIEEVHARTDLHRRDLNPPMPGVDASRTVPASVTSVSSSDASVEAGAPRAAMQPFTVRPGDSRRPPLQMFLPGKDAQEPLESISESWPLQVGVLMENERRQPGFLWELISPYLPEGLTYGMESVGSLGMIVQRAIQDAIRSDTQRRSTDWRYRKYQPRR